MRRSSLLILFLLVAQALAQDKYWVSTTGSPTGAGTIGDPWSIQRGLDHTATPRPGANDTLWLRGGTYTPSMMNDPNTFQFHLEGTSDAHPVIIRNYNNERVIWDCDQAEVGVYHGGQYSWLWGIEITSSRSPAGDHSGYLQSGYRNKFINGYIHDTQSTGVVSQQVQGTEVYGSIINYNGRQQVADEGPGYGAYAQNVIANLEKKTFKDCIIGYNWSWGLHFYTEGATCDSILVDGCTVFNSGLFWKVTSWAPSFLFTGPTGANRWFQLKNSVMYLGPEHGSGGHYFGLFGGPVTLMSATNNYFVATGGGLAFSFENDGGSNTITGNVLAGNTAGLSSYTSNTFLSSWPSTRPDDVVVQKNDYEPNRAHIITMNWDASSTISFNPNADGVVLESGDTYVVRDALNYYGGDIASGTWTSGDITVTVSGLTAATPVAGTPLTGGTPSHPGPEFTTLILIGGGTGGATEDTTLAVISPNGGEDWVQGTVHNISWISSPSGAPTNVLIEYSTNNGSSWITESVSTTNDGSYSWTVDNTPTVQGLVRISGIGATSVDQSNAAFTISSSPPVSQGVKWLLVR